MYKSFNYSKYFHSPEILANKVLELYFNGKEPSFPIDPFKMLKDFNVIVQLKGFKGLEGIYIAPEHENDIVLVGISCNRPATRQRFTAAHELCHHVKDKFNQIACPIGRKNPTELFADKFASELLMPLYKLKEQVKKYEKDGYVDFMDVVLIADYFGVSFDSCVRKIAYKLRKIDGDIDKTSLKKRITKFKPNKKRLELGLDEYDIDLLRNTINSYSYIIPLENTATWFRFKNDFVYNENRLEGLQITEEEVSEIATDLRLNKQKSIHCNSANNEIIQVVGHASVYDYIMETNDPISGFKMIDLNRMLFQYAPYPEESGKTRTTNNFVVDAQFETVDWTTIPNHIFDTHNMIKDLMDKKDEISVSEYIDKAVKIHHKITVIHPFRDGNGRVSRAMLNWLFKLNGLPPIYIKASKKQGYYEALELVDEKGDYSKLQELFYKSIMNSLIQLNEMFHI